MLLTLVFSSCDSSPSFVRSGFHAEQAVLHRIDSENGGCLDAETLVGSANDEMLVILNGLLSSEMPWEKVEGRIGMGANYVVVVKDERGEDIRIVLGLTPDLGRALSGSWTMRISGDVCTSILAPSMWSGNDRLTDRPPLRSDAEPGDTALDTRPSVRRPDITRRGITITQTAQPNHC